MMGNLDPAQVKNMMKRMGIKSDEIEAEEVVIKCKDKNIVISNPSVLAINMQGATTFQIGGNVREEMAEKAQITQDDIDMVKEQTGVLDEDLIRKTLEETNGDIAEAIIKLKG